MKTLVKIFFIITFIFFTYLTFSQTEHKEWDWEWAPVGAVWMYETANMGMNSVYSQYWYVRSAKDTIYEGVNCRKLEVNRHYWPEFEPVKMPDRFTYQDGGDIYFYNEDINEFVLSFSYDITKEDTVTWQMPVFDDCINEFYLDSLFYWNAGYLSGYGMQFTPYSIFMFSSTPIYSYKLGYVQNNCYAGQIGSYSTFLPNHGYGRYFDFFGSSSDIYELSISDELQNSCMCYYDGEVRINPASLDIINNDTIIFYQDSCINYYNQHSNSTNNISANTPIHVYPNPFTEQIIIRVPYLEKYEAEIISITGKSVYKTNISQKNNVINLESIEQGTYLLKITTQNQIFSKRIIKI